MTIATLEQAVAHGDYATFKALVSAQRRMMRARALRRLPAEDADECVETATMFAFRRYEARPRRVPVSRWMTHLLDEAVESRPVCVETAYDA